VVTAAKVDSFFVNSVPWQAGHAGAGAELRTSVSNSLPQPLHLYSNIGMTIALPKTSPQSAIMRGILP
jgi:hypothetical protein